MKFVKLSIIFLLTSLSSYSQKEKLDMFFNKTDMFMSMNVLDGRVDYEGIKENEVALNELVSLLESTKVKDIKDENYKKYFYYVGFKKPKR